MPVPSQTPDAGPQRSQASIRSFFQPQAQPKYAAPPSASRQSSQPPSVQQQHEAPPPPTAPPLPNAKECSKTQRPLVPLPAPTKTHHPNITLSPILPSHIPSLRHLTARLLPIRYPDSFYAALSDPLSSGPFSRVLLWTDSPSPSAPFPKPAVIGGLVCRPSSTFQPRPGSAQDVIPDALYIQSLVLQEPYRRLGSATTLLDEICRLAAKDERWRCKTVCAHVWAQNQEGMEWYMARGFTRVEPVIEEYYRQLQPSAAWIVRRDIRGTSDVMDAIQAATGNNSAQDQPDQVEQGRETPVMVGFTNTTSPPPSSASSKRPAPVTGTSYQNMRAETEWNDLPVEMQSARNNLFVPGSGVSSEASSRSSSTVGRKKRDRAYPAAAFGK